MDRNLRLLTVGVAIRMLGNAIFFPFVALFLYNELAVGYLEIGLIFVVLGVVQLPFGILGGLATDRLGRRRLILIGLLSEVLTIAGLAYAFWVHSLVDALLAAGVGGTVGTLSGPAFSAYIADLAEGKERTRGFTWYRVGFNAGYSAGVTLGGLLIGVIGYAESVAVAAGVVAVCLVLLAVGLAPSPFDVRLRAGKTPTPAGVAPAPAAPTRTLRESFRILARDRVALELLIAVVLAAVVVGQWPVTFPLYVHNVLGISYGLLGIGLALNGLVVVFGQNATTESVLGMRHTTIANLGLVLYLVAFLGLGAAGLYQLYPVAAFFAAVVVLTVGENLVTIPQATLPSNIAPAGEVGSYNGAFQTMAGAGFVAAVFLGGAVLAFTANPLAIWAILLVPAVPSILLFRHAARRLSPSVDRA